MEELWSFTRSRQVNRMQRREDLPWASFPWGSGVPGPRRGQVHPEPGEGLRCPPTGQPKERVGEQPICAQRGSEQP